MGVRGDLADALAMSNVSWWCLPRRGRASVPPPHRWS